mmetsp:Transcript_41563/g.130159  ORF Transcript_41563/g.130159 Transcript_41563/m.130159 type:complete len:207 (+) Transcript_41563:733-1353(+)
MQDASVTLSSSSVVLRPAAPPSNSDVTGSAGMLRSVHRARILSCAATTSSPIFSICSCCRRANSASPLASVSSPSPSTLLLKASCSSADTRRRSQSTLISSPRPASFPWRASFSASRRSLSPSSCATYSPLTPTQSSDGVMLFSRGSPPLSSAGGNRLPMTWRSSGVRLPSLSSSSFSRAACTSNATFALRSSRRSSRPRTHSWKL